MKESKRKINVYSVNKMIAIIKIVCENYGTGKYNLESVCENAGVPYRTFKYWWTKYEQEGSNDGSRWSHLAEVAPLWEAAKTNNKKIYNRELIELCESMLHKLIKGYTFEYTTTRMKPAKDENGNDYLKLLGITKHVKHFYPSVKLIIWVLEKLCPEIYNSQIIVNKSNPFNDKYDSYWKKRSN